MHRASIGQVSKPEGKREILAPLYKHEKEKKMEKKKYGLNTFLVFLFKKKMKF